MNLDEFLISDFEQIQVLRDEANSVLAFIAIHDTRLGPAFGGIRRWTYRSPVEGLEDALRLARAMTLKCAVSGIPGGGGKAVIVDDPAMDREAAYRLLGKHVQQMGGRYFTGPDVGTEASDLEHVGEETEYVARTSDGALAEVTSVGVFAGIEEVARQLGFSNLGDVHVAIQGLGGVGMQIANRLADAGAKLTITDVQWDLAERAAKDLSASLVEPGEILSVEADIFAPCALGGVIHDLSLKTMRAKAIAGSANNVLASPEHGVELFRKGVLYAPDFVINSGGLIHGALTHLDGSPPPESRIRHIGQMIKEILELAKKEDRPPEQIAGSSALDRLGEKPAAPYMP
ncbi:MAG: Leu/Phe/Val dehydrogenase [Planctomycetota bacterium]